MASHEPRFRAHGCDQTQLSLSAFLNSTLLGWLLFQAGCASWPNTAAYSSQSYLHPTSSPKTGCEQSQPNHTENGEATDGWRGGDPVGGDHKTKVEPRDKKARQEQRETLSR